MKNLLRLVFVAQVFYSSGLVASDWGRWLKAYDCKSKGLADTCHDCSLISDMQVRFAVDKSSQRVLLQYREGNTLKPPHGLEGCKVADKHNWSCRSVKSYPHLSQDGSQNMAGGVFALFFHEYPSRGHDTKWCAK